MIDLKDWTLHYIKQKDMMKKDLVSCKEEATKILCEHKDYHSEFYFAENFDLAMIKKLDEKSYSTLICICNEHNFKLLNDNWDLLKTRQNFVFIFLNENHSEKWIIKPYIHARIADPATLKQGLRTMYDTCMGNSN